MKQNEFDALVDDLMAKAQVIQERKQPSYTRGREDVLENFKSAASAAGITAEQAWVVFAKKHWDAICALLTQPALAVAEPPIERFADLVNYLKLGYALLRETKESPQPTLADAGLDEDTLRRLRALQRRSSAFSET